MEGSNDPGGADEIVATPVTLTDAEIGYQEGGIADLPPRVEAASVTPPPNTAIHENDADETPCSKHRTGLVTPVQHGDGMRSPLMDLPHPDTEGWQIPSPLSSPNKDDL